MEAILLLLILAGIVYAFRGAGVQSANESPEPEEPMPETEEPPQEDEFETSRDVQMTPHFNSSEFSNPAWADQEPDFQVSRVLTDSLEQFRVQVGNRPVKVLSGYRGPAHNASVGGVEHSQHLLGRAADVTVSGMTVAEMNEAAETVGFGGIGLYPSGRIRSQGFVHLDVRSGFARWEG